MAYEVPTTDDVKERFTRFADVDDDIIDILIAEAIRDIDTSWFEADYINGILYLVAHKMIMEDVLNESSPGFTQSSGEIISEKLGDASVTYSSTSANGSSGASGTDYSATVYGRRFLNLLKKNQPAILVV